MRDPELHEYPSTVAITAQLERLLALAPADRASLWVQDEAHGVSCLHAAGVPRPRDDAGALATAMIKGEPSEAAKAARQRLIAVPVMRWQQRYAALVVEPLDGQREECMLLAGEAAGSIAPLIERQVLLTRNAEKEHALVSASERALERLGLDLHDRPIQDMAALAEDIRLFRSQLSAVLDRHPRAEILTGRVDDLEARLVDLHGQLREMSHGLVSPMLLKRPLDALLRGEVRAFRAVTDIGLELELSGDFESLSVSQRVALLRIIQEALSNVREHAEARSVGIRVSVLPSHVEASVVDDGRGFDVHETFVDATRRGRLGLVGMGERARLLGGSCDIISRPGEETRVEIRLPRFDAAGEAGHAGIREADAR